MRSLMVCWAWLLVMHSSFFHLSSDAISIPVLSSIGSLHLTNQMRMWVVLSEFEGNGCHTLSIIHLDCVTRAAHLLPIYNSSFLLEDFHFADSLDLFHAYFVNSYIDH